jgi:hypothetical protein
MSLDDFFRINFPYGIKRNNDDSWFAFNREYLPLGWNSTEHIESIYKPDAYNDYPIHTKYKNLTENKILKIIDNPDAIRKDSTGKILTVHFYNDQTNPKISPEYWDRYFKIIKSFSSFEIKKQ